MHEWLALAGERARVLTGDAARGHRVAAALGVSDRALLCAAATELGAVLVDDGWARVLGGGAQGHEADLASVNGRGDRAHSSASKRSVVLSVMVRSLTTLPKAQETSSRHTRKRSLPGR